MSDVPNIANYLKYAELQMAAEAFIRRDTGQLYQAGTQLVSALKEGNLHASVFTSNQAESFAKRWKVEDQEANTKTGFSGTLFRCTVDDPATGAKVGDLVMSFRSTEFIDDAARDNQATNVLEVKELGFALGQIKDMEAWYARPKAEGKLKTRDQIAVTGYSLGGHLAAAGYS